MTQNIFSHINKMFVSILWFWSKNQGHTNSFWVNLWVLTTETFKHKAIFNRLAAFSSGKERVNSDSSNRLVPFKMSKTWFVESISSDSFIFTSSVWKNHIKEFVLIHHSNLQIYQRTILDFIKSLTSFPVKSIEAWNTIRNNLLNFPNNFIELLHQVGFHETYEVSEVLPPSFSITPSGSDNGRVVEKLNPGHSAHILVSCKNTEEEMSKRTLMKVGH